MDSTLHASDLAQRGSTARPVTARAVVAASFRDRDPRLTVHRADHDDLRVLALRVRLVHGSDFIRLAREQPIHDTPSRTLTRRRACSWLVRRAVSELELDPLTSEEEQLLSRWDLGLD